MSIYISYTHVCIYDSYTHKHKKDLHIFIIYIHTRMYYV